MAWSVDYIYSSILFSYRCISSECWFSINVLMTMIRINILCKFWILFPLKGYWIWSMSLYLDTFPCFIRIFIYLCGIWYHGYIIFLLASAQNIFPPAQVGGDIRISQEAAQPGHLPLKSDRLLLRLCTTFQLLPQFYQFNSPTIKSVTSWKS